MRRDNPVERESTLGKELGRGRRFTCTTIEIATTLTRTGVDRDDDHEPTDRIYAHGPLNEIYAHVHEVVVVGRGCFGRTPYDAPSQ